MNKQILPMLAGLIVLFGVGWYLDSLAHTEITQAVMAIVFCIAGTIIIGLMVSVAGYALVVIEQVREARAKRRLTQREAEVYTIESETHGIFVRDLNPQAVWRPLHLNPGQYQNGKQCHPNDFELAAWQTFILRNQRLTTNEQMRLLPAMAQVDLLSVLDNVQRCLVVGASDTGKTTLLQWIISRRLNTSKVIVVDPHAYPDKWLDCMVSGTGRNYTEVSKALNGLVLLMTKRYDEIGKGLVQEMAHTRITIVIDEWRAIVFNVPEASEAIKALLTESRKAAFSVFVASHSERVRALGIEGEGDLKDGFAIVRLLNVNGQRQATIDRGDGEIPALLPGAFVASKPHVIDTDDFINLDAEAIPTETEQQILEMYRAGESLRAISQAVFNGKHGQFYNQKIQAVLNKYSDEK